MDFSWEALEGSNARLAHLRQRVADWSSAATGDAAGAPDGSAAAFDARFRDAVSNDLDLPPAMVVLNELVSSPEVPGPAKSELLTAWDAVLGLDLDRLTREDWQPSDEVRALISARDEARSAKDWARSDEIRDQLAAMGLEVMDTPDGINIRPKH
jgi:cysteinyl-tRNA synthetase